VRALMSTVSTFTMHALNPTGGDMPQVRQRRFAFGPWTVILHAPVMVRMPAEIHQPLSEGVGGGFVARHPPQASQRNASESLCWFLR